MPGQGTYVIPVSNGILEHCAQIGVAIWVFLWMLDRTTKEAPGADGQTEGLVYGGRPIPARDIGNDLQMTVRTVHAHLKQLIDAGYLRTISFGDGIPPGYCVLKSKKWALKKRGASDLAENGGPSPNSADPYEKTAGTPTEKLQTPHHKTVWTPTKNTQGPCSFPAPLNRNNTLQHKTEAKTKSKAAPFVLPAWLPLDLWNAYLEMRHEKRKRPTEHAKDLVVRELDKLRVSGQDPGLVLDQSTRNGWTDVYELKGSNGNGTNHAKLSPGAARFDGNKAAVKAGVEAFARRRGIALEDDSGVSEPDGEGRNR